MTDRRDPRIGALIVELAESSPEAPAFEELEGLAARPVGEGRVRPLRTPRPDSIRGWTVGVAAAAVTLVLLGGLAWLAPFGGQAPPATEDSIPTTVEVTPATEAAITTDTAPASTTTLVAAPIVPPVEGPKLSFVQAAAPTNGELNSGEWFNGALYVLSFDREERSPIHELLRSTDGFTWEHVPGFPSSAGIERSMLQTDGNRLVNVAMPEDGNRGIGDDAFITVNTSANGDDWISSTITLPVPVGSNMAGEFQLGNGFYVSDNFAVGPKGIVVTADIELAFDGEGFANNLVNADDAIHVEIVELDIDQGVMIVSFHDEDNGMEQIGDLREIDLKDAGFSGAFSNLLDSMAADPAWEPLVPDFIAQLAGEAAAGVSVAYAWFSPDGVTWQRIDNSGPLDGGAFSAIGATPDGFVATASNTYEPGSQPTGLQHLTEEFDSSIVWQSTDGTTWTGAPGLTSQHGFRSSRIVEWQGELVEHVGAGSVGDASDNTRVLTLTDPAREVFSEIPTAGMILNFSEFGLIGSPAFGWGGPDATELLFSVDGTNWNRWEPTEFSIGVSHESPGEHVGAARIVGVGDDFVVLQHTRWDADTDTTIVTLWVGRVS